VASVSQPVDVPDRATAQECGYCLHIEEFGGDDRPRVRSGVSLAGSVRGCDTHDYDSSEDGTMPPDTGVGYLRNRYWVCGEEMSYGHFQAYHVQEWHWTVISGK